MWKEALDSWSAVLPMVSKQEEAILYKGVQDAIVEAMKNLKSSASSSPGGLDDEEGGIELDD